MSLNAEDPLSVLQTLASVTQAVNLSSVACLTWVMYDTLASLDEEIEYIWKARWTIVKVLYISMRYFGLLWVIYETVFHILPGTSLSKLA
ncbi:hypothetical protein Hypma_007175 [Hypsizygus marmoreus]|uniref:DUF6533 domain-containing protein n=1 Tax=Hypsizygus marmoreus TaxID=39966 RepID=A0A369K8M0_HYPMA|nr:hypothetical protein Hypma_007175 [Hypsizygus marmoreus]